MTEENLKEILDRRTKQVKRRIWRFEGKIHRSDGPADVSYFKNGKVRNVYWCRRGKLHRHDGPANVRYNAEGKIVLEDWFLEGKRHRLDGPATTDNRRGKTREYWALYGVSLTSEEYKEYTGLSEIAMLVRLFQKRHARHILKMIRLIDKQVARNVRAGTLIE